MYRALYDLLAVTVDGEIRVVPLAEACALGLEEYL